MPVINKQLAKLLKLELSVLRWQAGPPQHPALLPGQRLFCSTSHFLPFLGRPPQSLHPVPSKHILTFIRVMRIMILCLFVESSNTVFFSPLDRALFWFFPHHYNLGTSVSGTQQTIKIIVNRIKVKELKKYACLTEKSSFRGMCGGGGRGQPEV